MAKRLFGGSIQLLVLLIALVGGRCLAADGQGPEDARAAAEAVTMDLYGPDADDMDDLVPVSLVGINDMSASSSAKLTSAEDNDDEPEVWKEPEHKMDLIRFFHGLYYETQYNKINELLVREVETPNLEENFEILIDWLERERKKGVSLFNRATVEALQQLVDLYHLKGQRRCDRDAYAIIFKNDQATSGRAHKPPTSLKPLRRVDSLVYQLFSHHAIECFNEYPQNYARVRDTMNKDVRRMVETFLDSVMGDPLATTSKVHGLDKKNVATIAYNYLRVNALDDRLAQYLGKVVNEKNGKLHVNDAKVRELVNKYIVQPCKDYQQALGPDVFLPARFDVKMLLHEDRYESDSRLMNEFMHSYIHFSLCEKLIRRDEPYLARNVVKHIYSIFK